MSAQLTLFVDFYVQPTRIEEWKAAHRPVWAAVSRKPDRLLFDVFYEADEPGHFGLVEVWSATREWFKAVQLKRPYYDELWKKSEPTYAKGRRIEFFERLGEGCSYKKGYLDGGKCMD